MQTHQSDQIPASAVNLLGNYARAPLSMVRGRGSRVWDAAGREYLDFASGIAVTSIGHCHPKWVRRVQEQVARLVHCSNAFHIPQQADLAARLVSLAGPGRIVFSNSGAESNEALIKLARLHGRAREKGVEGRRYRILCAEKAFHGRTFGGMSATPQEKIQGGFRPMLDGFAFGRLNDLESFARLVDDRTAAIFLETVQGEGGVHPCEPAFLQGIRDLCTREGLVMMLDEVQCGVGRTGHFFAFQRAGIVPDAIGMAKGLGGGFPIGAVWVAEAYAGLFTSGSHGSTFAGSPLACTAALAVLEVIEEEGLIDRVRRLSPGWLESLGCVARDFPDLVSEVRGLGFMVALATRSDPQALIEILRHRGMLTMRAGDNSIRLLPPLNVPEEDLAESVRILREALSEHRKSAPAP